MHQTTSVNYIEKSSTACLLLSLFLQLTFCSNLLALPLMESEKKQAEAYLQKEISIYQDLASHSSHTEIRIKFSSQPLIQAVAVWDENDNLIYPENSELYHVTDYAFTKSHERFDTLRHVTERNIWDRYDVTADSLLYCLNGSSATCLQVNSNELAKELNTSKESLLAAIFQTKQQGLVSYIVLLLIFSALIGLAIYFKTKHKTASVSKLSTGHLFMMGDMQIDPQRMCISRASYTCDISLRDLKLLTCLHEHPDEVLTKDKLYNAGWGRDFLPSSRSLEQHIVTLRKKIDPDRSRTALIVTVHGLGYKYPADSL